MISQSPCRQACAKCAQIKQACDGSRPCSRCLRTCLLVSDDPLVYPETLSIIGWLSSDCEAGLGVNCVSKGSAVEDGAVQLPSETARVRIKRVHTGCSTCKKRRKKCDEVKPKCGDCKRLSLHCSWPSNSRAHPRPQITATSSSSSPVTPSESNVLSAVTAVLPLESPEITSQYATRDFDLNLIDFSAEFDVEDVQDQAVLSPFILPPASDSASSPSTSDLGLTIPTTLPDLTSAEDRALLNHFVQIVAPTLSRTDGPDTRNPYLANLIPMVYENDIVLDSVLCLSASHWRKSQPQLSARGQYHQSNATQALVQLLPQVDDRNSADVALVSSLILCMSELFDGISTSWKFHLTGAKRLLLALQDRKRCRNAHHRFLVRLYHFLDSAATTSTCRPPVIQQTQESTSVEGAGSSPASLEQDFGLTDNGEEDAAIYGIPKCLFHLVDRVNTLAYKRRFRVDEASENTFRNEAIKVEHSIDNWSYEYGGVARAVSNLCAGNQDAQHASIAFEWALRLRLHQIVEGYSLEDPIVASAVTNVIDATQKIRYGSRLESCLLYPLVMAGSACNTMEQRIIIQDRLTVMEKTCGFGYLHGARELVEKVWNRRAKSSQGTIVNWARIRFEEMDGLVVF